MMIYVSCKCGKRLKAGDGLAGRTVQCSQCGARLKVTSSSPPVPPPRPAPTTPPKPRPPVATPVGVVDYVCPHCASPLQVDAVHAGGDATCGVCGGRTVVPDRRQVLATAPATCFTPLAPKPAAQADRKPVNIPILVSAIANLIVGMLWISTICGAVFGVPMVLLCVFEFIHYSRSDDLPAETFASRSELLGVLEIFAGLFNMVSFVCGILVLVMNGKFRRAIRGV